MPTKKTAPPEDEDKLANGVVVTLDEDGKLDVATLGTTSGLEAPALLRLAAKQVEEHLGL